MIIFLSYNYVVAMYVDWSLSSMGFVGKEIAMQLKQGSFDTLFSQIITISVFLLGIFFLPRLFHFITESTSNIVIMGFIAFYFIMIMFSLLRSPQEIINCLGLINRYLNAIFIATACTVVVAKNFRLIMTIVYLVITVSILYLLINRGTYLITNNLLQMERLAFGTTIPTGTGYLYVMPIFFIFLSNGLASYIQGKKFALRALEYLLFIGSSFVIFITYSRGAYLALISALLFFYRKNIFFIASSMSLLLLILLISIATGNIENIRLTRQEGDEITTGRVELWTTTLKSFIYSDNTIIFGVNVDVDPHNSILGILVNYGLIGLMVWLCIHISILLLLYRLINLTTFRKTFGDLGERMFAVMIGILILSLVDNAFYHNLGLTLLYNYLVGIILLMNSSWLKNFSHSQYR